MFAAPNPPVADLSAGTVRVEGLEGQRVGDVDDYLAGKGGAQLLEEGADGRVWNREGDDRRWPECETEVIAGGQFVHM